MQTRPLYSHNYTEVDLQINTLYHSFDVLVTIALYPGQAMWPGYEVRKDYPSQSWSDSV